jgi:cytochrome c oxidase subunit III
MAAEVLTRNATAEQFDAPGQERAAAGLGMWVFLATEVLFFGAILASYTVLRVRVPDAFAAGSQRTDMFWGTVETAVLLTSSTTMAWAVRAAQLAKRSQVTHLLAATMGLGAVFFAIHVHEYAHDFADKLVPGIRFAYEGPLAGGVELFFFLYYVTTLLHLTHLTIGVAVLGVVAMLNHRGRFDRSYYTPVEIAGLYWHFVDIVWIFLFPLFYLVSRT